jgi:undecaprenyl-diphosphatase
MISDAVIFGILQGFLEWIPISSQGNLILIMVYFFGLEAEQALNYSIFIHIGTSLAATTYFRKEISALFKALPNYRLNYSTNENRLISFLLLATMVTGALGSFLFKLTQKTTTAPGEVFIAIIGIALIITGLVQKLSQTQGARESTSLNLKDTLILGFAQAFSAIPGVSRSGITTSSLIFRKFKGEEALRLSFLMSIPAVLGAEIGLAIFEGIPAIGIGEILAGVLSSFLVGLISIHALLKIARKIKFWALCLLLGTLALIPMISHILA